MARTPVIEQIKMLCLSNKKEITEIKFSCTNFLNMIIIWAIFAAFIWKCAAASAFFLFLFIRKIIFLAFSRILFCNPSVPVHIPSQRLAHSATVKVLCNIGHRQPNPYLP